MSPKTRTNPLCLVCCCERIKKLIITCDYGKIPVGDELFPKQYSDFRMCRGPPYNLQTESHESTVLQSHSLDFQSHKFPCSCKCHTRDIKNMWSILKIPLVFVCVSVPLCARGWQKTSQKCCGKEHAVKTQKNKIKLNHKTSLVCVVNAVQLASEVEITELLVQACGFWVSGLIWTRWCNERKQEL